MQKCSVFLSGRILCIVCLLLVLVITVVELLSMGFASVVLTFMCLPVVTFAIICLACIVKGCIKIFATCYRKSKALRVSELSFKAQLDLSGVCLLTRVLQIVTAGCG